MRPSFIPIPIFLMVILFFLIFPRPIIVFEPPWLLPILNFIFIFSMYLVVAYIAARGYMATGSFSLLMLSCGVLEYGLSSLAAGWLESVGPNAVVTMHNSGVLTASILHLIGSIILFTPFPPEAGIQKKKFWLIFSFLGVLFFTVILFLAVVHGKIAPFYISGVGPTAVRQVILLGALAAFAFSFLLVMRLYTGNRAIFLYWYSLALGLIAVGILSILIQRVLGGPINWTGRIAQYLAGVYFLIATLKAIHEAKAKGVLFSRFIAASFHPAEKKFRALAENSPDMINRFDRELRLVYTNPAGLNVLGKAQEAIIGKPIGKTGIPEAYPRLWEERIKKVFETGNPQETEESFPAGMNELRHYHSRFVPELTRDGKVEFVLVVSRDITERKRAEEALNLSQKTFFELVERAPFGIYIVDFQFRIAHMNASSQTGTFQNVRPLIGRDFSEAMRILWPEPVAAEIIAAFRHTLETGEPYYSPRFTHPRHDVETVESYEWELHRMMLPDGQYGVICYYFDSTRLREAEESLRETQGRLLIAKEAADLGIHDYDINSGAIRWDAKVRDLWGVGEAEPVTYDVFMAGLHPDDRAATQAAVDRALDAKGNGKYYAEYRVINRRDGVERWLAATGKVFFVEGQALRLIGTVQDITERKRMEEELRRSRDDLELRVQERTAELKKQAELIDLSHDAILVRDMENRIIFWSRGAEEMYGWRKEEVLGKVAYELFQTQYPLPMNEIMAALREKGRWDGELSHIRRDGQTINVLSRQAVRRDESGKAIAILQINIDITQRKKVEEQLRQAHKMEALGTLAGGIAHDFNNLLAPISINTELALWDIKAGLLPSADSLEMALSSARRGKELVQQIITFSRHKGEELKPVDIAPIAKETIKFLRSAIPTTVRFETRIEDPSGLVLANPTQIHQVLMNLVNNAASSMEEGGILEITLEKLDLDNEAREGMPPGAYLCLKVKDTGCGMTPEVQEKAFDPFFTTKAPGKGAGMGLAVVHGIVKKHRGDIRLDSEPGKGTTVSVFLPLFRGMKEEELPYPPLNIRGGSERILFIDDEELQTRTAEAMLKRLGYRAVTETDPRRALEIFRAQPDAFDLVITDQVMPYLPGKRLSQELLSLRPDIPIILCTGFSETVDEEKAGAFGIREFILKPFTTKEISQVIRKVLGPKKE